jgi:type IV secretory pathway VirB3-like protein
LFKEILRAASAAAVVVVVVVLVLVVADSVKLLQIMLLAQETATIYHIMMNLFTEDDQKACSRKSKLKLWTKGSGIFIYTVIRLLVCV